MLLRFITKMLWTQVWCPILFVAGVQTLSIDSQLGTSIEDCFERISIGEQLPFSAIYRNVTELTTRECEQICRQDKQCQTYDYGVGAKGNATCDLSNVNEKELKEKNLIMRHPDYDIYVRRFQCEQSPPTPLQTQLDEGVGPAHRPVFRPEVEDTKRPLADDFPPDLRPFESNRPDVPFNPYRPSRPYPNAERPDDYNNQKPDFDRPPSYGLHRPQDTPFRPERPHQSHKPDGNDVLQFQTPRPGLRPDPYNPYPVEDVSNIYGQKPSRPGDSRPGDPPYQYIHRPNKRPSYNNDLFGPIDPYKPNYSQRPYERPTYDYNSQYASNYGQNQYPDNSVYVEIYDPPRPYRPPNVRPIYGTGYGTYGQSYGYGNPGSYDFGSPSSQNHYAQSQNSNLHYYGTQSESHNGYNRPQYLADQRPSHGSQGYGSLSSPPLVGYGSTGYGTQSHKPHDYGTQGLYGSNQSLYGGNHANYGNNQGYGSLSSPTYGVSYHGTHQSPYGSSEYQGGSYGNKPMSDNRPLYGNIKPLYNDERPLYGANKPSYNDDRPSYVANKPSYNDDKPSYGSNKPNNDERPSYGNKPSYNGDRPLYGSNTPSYSGDSHLYGNKPSHNDQPSYGSNKPSYNDERPSYGTKPLYNDERPSYGMNDYKPAYGVHKPTYGNGQPYGGNTPSYNDERPSYGQKPSYNDDRPYESKPPVNDELPSYGVNKPSHNDDRPSYGNNPSHNDERPLYDLNKPSYNDDRPSYGIKPSYNDDRPLYGLHKPSYNDDRPSYGNIPSYNDDRPSYGNTPSYNDDRPSYGNKPSYSDDRPSYGVNKPLHDERPPHATHKPSYNDDRPSYGNTPSYNDDRPSYGNKPSYSDDRPSYGVNKPLHDERPPHATHKPSYNDDRPSYGTNKPSYNDDRPSYGNKPSYSDDRPSYGVNKPLHDERPSHVTHKPSYHDDRPSYGTNKPSYNDYRPSYSDVNRPDGDLGPQFDDTPGYGVEDSKNSGHKRPQKTNQTDYYKPSVKPVYEFELDKPNNVPSYIVRPSGEVITSRPVTIGDYGERIDQGREPGKERFKACFRRVLAGRRALRSHVRRVVPCETLEECRKECATERRFHCESFNYRLDLSFRGKGLCELMTKPIESFDLRRDFVEDKDYDFYEIDRNSLEPHCPETLPGPGLLHSGYLSSKPSPQEQELKGNEWFYDDRRGGGRRRYEDQLYVPYQIGIGRSNDIENWGQYGGQYGGHDTYYKDRNDYHKSINHWRLSEQQPYRPNTNFNYQDLGKGWSDKYGYGWKRGRWNSSGGGTGLDISESSYYRPKPAAYDKPVVYEVERSEDNTVKDCTSRRRAGMSLGTGAIRRSLFARNVVECEAACFNEHEFKCVSYSYRYSSAHGSDNCYLSERPYRGLELSADSGSDVYAMPQQQGCSVSHKPWVESECFWHVRSGAAVDGVAVRAALTVAGLGACEAECIRAHAFFCRGFSFRFDSPTIGDDLENCILTSTPPTSLENDSGLRPNSGHELYARGNYGRGCEPALYDDVQHRDTQSCYLQYDNAAKLTGSAVRGQTRAADEQACGAACTAAPFRCLSFSYNNNAPPDADNCLLSQIRLFDLQRDVDYEHSTDDWLFAFDLFNGQCWRKVHGTGEYEEPVPELPRPLVPPPTEDSFHTSSPSGPQGYLPAPAESSYIPGSGPPSGPGYKHHPDTFIPSHPPSSPGYLPEPDPPGYLPKPYPETGPGYKPRPEYSERPEYRPGHRPTGPSYGPDTNPGYRPEVSGPGYRPDPGYRPSGHDYRPSEPSGPSYRPSYRPETGPGYRPETAPGYRPEISGPGYRPSEPSGPGYRPEVSGPGYRPEVSGPGYRPEVSGPGYRPEVSGPGYRPEVSGPGYRPEVSGPGYRPEVTGPSYHPQEPSGYKPGYLPERPSYPDSRPGYRPSGPSGPSYRPPETSGPAYIPSGPSGSGYIPPDRPGYGRPGVEKPLPGHREEPIAVSWRHYTVSGYPCRQGSACAQNQVAGHWACEPEGGEVGSWDYCCAPTHRCGYSEGFHKPWCYVGPNTDQWRPCSEKYYPYHQHNIPHPSQGNRGDPQPSRPFRPSYPDDRYKPRPYLPEADRRYWDDLYKNGPQAYYDKYGNPLPGYTRVPTRGRPYIKYHHNEHRPGGHWVPVTSPELDPPAPGGLGAPRYWPVAYLHRGPPPNITYFRYNETDPTTEQPKTTTFRNQKPTQPFDVNPDKPNGNGLENTQKDDRESHRDVKTRNITNEDVFNLSLDKITTTTPKVEENVTEEVKEDLARTINESEAEITLAESVKADKDIDNIKGIDGKLDDFSKSIEILDIEDAKGEKMSDLKTLEAEERQIEAIGRLLASRRDGKLVIEKRSQKELETKNIAVDKELADFNFGNRFPTRKGIVQKVAKEEIDKDKNIDRSLEVSETTFVRPPRVLSTTEGVRKAIVNGKIFYDATVRDREQRDVFNATRKERKIKSLRPLEERAPSILNNTSFGKKKVIRVRNVNPVRKVRRVYRRKYNPDEVRRRLLERERSKTKE